MLLSFVKNNRVIRSPRIRDSILQDPDLDIVVWAAAAECYITNFSLIQVGEDDIRSALEMVGNIRTLLREAGPSEIYYNNDELNAETLANRTRCLIRIRSVISTHPIEIFHLFSLSVEDDIFMESLVNNVRNEVTSYQNFLGKFKNKKKN